MSSNSTARLWAWSRGKLTAANPPVTGNRIPPNDQQSAQYPSSSSRKAMCRGSNRSLPLTLVSFGPRSRKAAGRYSCQTCAGSMTWSSTLMIRGISMMSSLTWGRRVRSCGRSAVADEAAGPRAAGAGAVAGQLAVYPDLVQPVAAGDEPVRPGRQVPDPLHPFHPDRGRVERDQVGEVARGDAAPAGDPEDRGRVPGDPPDGLLQRQRAGLPDPVLQQVGGEDRVAELAGVRARVGQAQQGAVVPEQSGERGGIVVGDHDPETGPQVIVERYVAQHVERIDAELAAQLRERGPVGQLGVRRRLGHEYLVPAVVPLAGHVRPGPLPPGRVTVEPGPFGGRYGQHLRERVGAGERGRLGQGDLEDDRAARDLRPDLAAAGLGLVQEAEGAR